MTGRTLYDVCDDLLAAADGRPPSGSAIRAAVAEALDLLAKSPKLTPAQEHAEELADLLRKAIKSDEQTNGATTPAWARLGQELLNKIDPPAPPTAQELAAALAVFSRERLTALEYGAAVDSARAIVGRARAAGLL